MRSPHAWLGTLTGRQAYQFGFFSVKTAAGSGLMDPALHRRSTSVSIIKHR